MSEGILEENSGPQELARSSMRFLLGRKANRVILFPEDQRGSGKYSLF